MNMKNGPAAKPRDDDVVALAERVRAAVVRAGLDAFEDAGLQGLCCEGAWELAVSAMRAADLRAALTAPTSPKA